MASARKGRSDEKPEEPRKDINKAPQKESYGFSF
jgi:hypothetical protein